MLGNDLSRIVPSEVLRLANDLTKLQFLQAYLDRQLMQFEMTGQEPKGKGPMVVCLDKSESMTGENNCWATAVAMALGSIAAAEGRVFSVLSFNTSVTHEATMQKGEKVPMSVMEVGCYGGTNINVAYARALKIIQENPSQLKTADIVLVTDGESPSDLNTTSMRSVAKSMGVKGFGIAIGAHANSLRPWCDNVETVDDVHSMSDKLATQLFA